MAQSPSLAGTLAETPDRQQCEEQVRRVLRSATFRNAATLQQLFSYLAARSAAGAAETPKEYTIGVEALGRSEDFDPKIDPIVRVQSHRLRGKLKEYYTSEGSQDSILIQIPKGQYLPTFENISPGGAVPAETVDASEPHTPVSSTAPRIQDQPQQTEPKPAAAASARVPRPWWIFATVAAIALAAIGFWSGTYYAETHVARAPSDLKDPVESFWARFLGDDRTPVIAYTDAVFLLDDSNTTVL